MVIFFILSAVTLLFVIVLHHILDPEQREMNETARKDAPGSFVTLSDGVTHYCIRGSKHHETIVLIHGISLPSYSWDTLADALAANGMRVITYDLYGRGYSDRPDIRYDSLLYERQLKDLLNALAIHTPVCLLGISMGGGIVEHFAANNPEQIRKIILLTPLHTGYKLASLIALPPLGNFLMATVGTRKMIRLQQHIAAELSLPKEWSVPYQQQMTFKGYRRAILSSVLNFTNENHYRALKKIDKLHIPTLLIWGKNDSVIPFSGHKKVLHILKNAKFLPLDNTGHLIHLARHDIVLNSVLTFCDTKQKTA